MNRTIKSLIIIVFAIVLAANMICVFSAEAKSITENKDDLDKLEALENEIKQELSGLKGEISKVSADLNAAETVFYEASKKVDECEARIEKTGEDIRKKREIMKMRIKHSYENPGVMSFFEMILCCKNLSDLINIREYVRAVALYDKKVIEDYNREITYLKEEKKELKELQKEQEKKQKQLEKEKGELLKKINEANAGLSETREEIEKLENVIKKMEEYERQIAASVKPDTSMDKSPQEKGKTEPVSNSPIRPVAGEEDVLAAIIYCEAGNEPYEGMLAVGSVVLNRVRDSRFPNTITEVVYAPGQFTPVQSGRFALSIENGLVSEQAKQAARDVLAGNITGDWLYFRRNDGTKQGDVISRQVFYR